MLGNIDSTPLLEGKNFGNIVLGPAMFILFNLSVGFVVLNLFFSLVSETFTKTRIERHEMLDENDMGLFIKEKFYALKNKFVRKKYESETVDENQHKQGNLRENHEILNLRMNNILSNLHYVLF